jgi:FkbH-like protein
MSEARPLQPWELSNIPVHKLATLARKIKREDISRTIRLAVLGDAATQHYCQTLGAILKLRGWWPEIYEAEYDTLHQEILNPESGLHAHKSEFVIFFNCVQAIASKFWGAQDKRAFAEKYLLDLESLWEKLSSSHPARILQHTLVRPLELPLGNQSSAQDDTFFETVGEINKKLKDAAVKRKIHLIDTEFQASYYGKRHWFDERLWCQAKQALSPIFLPALVKTVSDVVLSDLGDALKCVVVDLDNTMWGGILADDGADKIEIGQTEVGLVFLRFQFALAELKRHGMLLAICSKNNLEPVLSVLDSHPDMILRREDFAAIVANYDDKANNIRAIREKLNIGFDSMVFLDDSRFERDLVRSSLPEVQVPELPEDPADYLTTLARLGLFESRPTTAEDRDRQRYYKNDEARETLREQHIDFYAYLKDLKMKAVVSGFNGFTLPRVSQLVQRSNQFNLTTIRYSEAELAQIGKDRSFVPFCLRLSDKLGDNGIISVVILRLKEQEMLVDTWIMSCRVLGRGIDEFTLNLIAQAAKNHGCHTIIGKYVPTQKNEMVTDLYGRLGFSDACASLGPGFWTLALGGFEPRSTLIEQGDS